MNSINNDTVIAIAGTVGVGKSTLTQKLADKLNFKTSFEMVEGNPYLDKYYENFERWGFHLQIFFLAQRFKENKKIFEYGGGFVQDRTIYEDLEIFAKMNFDNKTMAEDDYETYKNLFEAMVLTPFFKKPDIIIYLEGDMDTVLNRIKERGRESELSTDEEYWQNLHQRYTEWIDNFNHTPLLRLNINDYDVEDEKSIDMIINKMNNILIESNK